MYEDLKKRKNDATPASDPAWDEVKKEVSQTDATKAINKLKSKNVNAENIRTVLTMKKGDRPTDQNVYLPDGYVEEHKSLFDKGAAFIQNGNAYFTFSYQKPQIGDPAGLFITTSEVLNNVQGVARQKKAEAHKAKKTAGLTNEELKNYKSIESTKGRGVYEEALGFNTGDITSKGGFVRFDIKNPKAHNLRLPTGNERGAWDGYWVPGGYTAGGQPEGVINPIESNAEDLVARPKLLGKSTNIYDKDNNITKTNLKEYVNNAYNQHK